MIFPYVDRGYGFMPIIPVTLMKGGCCIAVEALVDSGAGRSVFDAELAEAPISSASPCMVQYFCAPP